MPDRVRQPNRYRPSLAARASIAAFNLAGRAALRNYNRKTRDAAQANRKTLGSILKLNGDTVFGQAHRFEFMRTSGNPVETYRQAVPLTKFADYSAYLELIAAGRDNVLTRDPIDVLAGSAGTTDIGKRLPNTKRARRKFMYFVPLVLQGVLARQVNGAASAQRGINLMSRYTPVTDCHRPVTSANNTAMSGLSRLIPLLWSSPAAVFGIGELQTALYLHALFGLVNRDAPYISAVFATQLVSFFAIIEEHREQLVRDIAAGSVSDHLPLCAPERNSIEAALAPDSLRAEELRIEFDKGFENIAPRLWPSMRYVATVTTGSFSVHVPRLRSRIGDDMLIYSPCHASSEAMVGINLRPGKDDYALALGSAFYEFIPLAHTGEAQPETVGVDDVQAGQAYEVVLTNFAGLYRYRLEDVVRITGFHGTAPRFEFLYRKGAILNLAGEKTTEWHTTRAVSASVARVFGSANHLRDFTIAAQLTNGMSNYAFYIEIDPACQATESRARATADRLDLELCNANAYYRSNGRVAGALGPATIHFVAAGTFDALAQLQDHKTHGVVTSQIKTPRIVSCADQIRMLDRAVVASGVGRA